MCSLSEARRVKQLMSRIFFLSCVTCRITVWVGEEINDHSDDKAPELILYRTNGFSPAATFLYAHQGHQICFTEDPPDGFVDLDGDDPRLKPLPLDSE